MPWGEQLVSANQPIQRKADHLLFHYVQAESGDAEFRIAVAINHTVSGANCDHATRHLTKVVPGNRS